MAGKTSIRNPDQREALRQRLVWVRTNIFGGRHRRMARAIGLSSGLLSNVINGKQAASRGIRTALHRVAGLNPLWIETGQGRPVVFPETAVDMFRQLQQELASAPVPATESAAWAKLEHCGELIRNFMEQYREHQGGGPE